MKTTDNFWINKIFYEGIKTVRNLTLSPPLRILNASIPSYTLCSKLFHNESDILKCILGSRPIILGHFSGTCRIGYINDVNSVVDERLRVIGIKNMRVVDASVMPEIISGNIEGAVVMIAEKAADMIKEDLLLQLI